MCSARFWRRLCESVLFMSKAITLSRKSSRQAWWTAPVSVANLRFWWDTKWWSPMDIMDWYDEIWWIGRIWKKKPCIPNGHLWVIFNMRSMMVHGVQIMIRSYLITGQVYGMWMDMGEIFHSLQSFMATYGYHHGRCAKSWSLSPRWNAWRVALLPLRSVKWCPRRVVWGSWRGMHVPSPSLCRFIHWSFFWGFSWDVGGMMPAMMRPWRSTMDLPNCAMRAKRTTSDMRELIWLSKTCFIRTCLRGLPPGGDDLLQKWYPPSLPVIQTAQRSGVEITVKTLEAKKNTQRQSITRP